MKASGPGSPEPERSPGKETRRGSRAGRLDRSRRRSRREHSHWGKEDEKGGWEGGEGKGTCARSGALINQRGRARRRGDVGETRSPGVCVWACVCVCVCKPGQRGREGQRKWPKKWNKGLCAWVCLGARLVGREFEYVTHRQG